MKKLIAFVLAAMLLTTACFAAGGDIILIAPNPNAAPKTVTVRVEGLEGSLGMVTVALNGDNSALWAIEQALNQLELDYTVAESPYGGSYITKAAGLQEGDFGGYEGWLYYVDGISPAVSMSLHELKGGEDVVFIYTDFDVLVPIVEAGRDRADMVTLTLTADVTTYDENWNVTVTRQPVAEATFTVEGETYVTDAQGKAVLSAGQSAKEAVSVQVNKKNALGLPALLPLHPDYQLTLTDVKAEPLFTDVAEGKWYTDAVLQMADLGAVAGFPDGTFQPEGTVTRAQVANVLFKLSGGIPVNYLMTFSDVSQGAWYAEGIRWAASQKIVTGADGMFRPDEPVTRQDLAVMLDRWQQSEGVELDQSGEAPAFADNDQIAAYAAESVYRMQKAGVINGIDGSFQPKGTATRAQLCKMLAGLVVSD